MSKNLEDFFGQHPMKEWLVRDGIVCKLYQDDTVVCYGPHAKVWFATPLPATPFTVTRPDTASNVSITDADSREFSDPCPRGNEGCVHDPRLTYDHDAFDGTCYVI